MGDFKIDPAKYAGLPPEEARRRIAEDERRAINADPALPTTPIVFRLCRAVL
jgi:hypothetical protein